MIYVIYKFNENLVNEKRPLLFHLGGGRGVKGRGVGYWTPLKGLYRQAESERS